MCNGAMLQNLCARLWQNVFRRDQAVRITESTIGGFASGSGVVPALGLRVIRWDLE